MRFRTADGEAALYKGETEAKEGKRELGEIEMAIHNIYHRCVKVKGPPPDGLELYLEAIKQRVVDLQSIVHDIRQRRKEQAQLASMMAAEEAAAAAKGGVAPKPAGGGAASAGAGMSSPGATGRSVAPSRGPAADGTHGSQSFGQSGSGLSGPPSKREGTLA